MNDTHDETAQGEFSVYQFFPGDDYEEVLRFVDAETAVCRAKALTQSVGGRLGTTQRVIITDGGGCIVFEWKHGEGVVFPPHHVPDGEVAAKT